MLLTHKNLDRLEIVLTMLFTLVVFLPDYLPVFPYFYILMVVVLTGNILIVRLRKNLPVSEAEKSDWAETSAMGKKAYVRQHLIWGVNTGMILSALYVLKNTLAEKPPFEDFAGLFLKVMGLALFLSYFFSINKWIENERKFGWDQTNTKPLG